jgi:NAD+ synthase (glutamine-hydrolysing)
VNGQLDEIMERKCILATCNLNQWALDFDGNLNRTIASIEEAKIQGARLRVGPELELSGYSCEDHFLELDTYIHSYESLCSILASDLTDGILCVIGCPILHNSVRYNCMVFCLNRKILLVRPKIYLADDGNYREKRYFASWKRENELSTYYLPDNLREVTGQYSVPMGVAMLRTHETTIATEICEELWCPDNIHVHQSLLGAEIICNGSGSHHQLRKLSGRLMLMQDATRKVGGVYLYANHRGCDGNRLYFDGSALICMNGNLLAQASQFSFREVEVITATIDMNDILIYRQSSASLQTQSSQMPSRAIPLVTVDFSILTSQVTWQLSQAIQPRLHSPDEECAYGPACWLWDYLRRSGASGFLLPLSGGADSSSVATIVYAMCIFAVNELKAGNLRVREDLVSLLQLSEPIDDISISSMTASVLCRCLLNTVYMGSSNSSAATRRRAGELAEGLGAYHSSISIDGIVSAILAVFTTAFNVTPRYESQGGGKAEDLALQNIQARVRMVMAYLCAGLFPWIRNRRGFLLVLGSANVDEALRGYMTKYDCSSADVNPIGNPSSSSHMHPSIIHRATLLLLSRRNL